MMWRAFIVCPYMVTDDGSDEARVVGAQWCYEGGACQLLSATSSDAFR